MNIILAANPERILEQRHHIKKTLGARHFSHLAGLVVGCQCGDAGGWVGWLTAWGFEGILMGMTAAEKWELVSEEDYLREELVAERKHEYVGGIVHAMAGASNRHNEIVVNCLANLYVRLRGKTCKPFNSDSKVRIALAKGTRYYHPDAMVICRTNPGSDTFQDDPVLIIEVLSDSTRRIDEGEKKDAYLTVPSLEVYIMVDQEAPLAVVFRRTGSDFDRSVISGLDAVIPVPGVGIELPLSEIYEGVAFEES